MNQQTPSSPQGLSPDHDKLEQLELQHDEKETPDNGDYGSNSDSDNLEKYRLEQNPERPRKKQSEKRRLDAAIFESWIEQDQRQRLQEALGASKASDGLEKLLDDEIRPDNAIICSPREYQVELFERAKTRNTIVVLDTGE